MQPPAGAHKPPPAALSPGQRPARHGPPCARGPVAARAAEPVSGADLQERIASGEFTEGSTKEKLTRPLRKVLARDPVLGRSLSYGLTKKAREWQQAARDRMPEAKGDVRQLVGEPVFVPLYNIFLKYGKVFRLSFGPKSFVVISDPALAKQVLLTNASRYSKGILSEILEFLMGQGLIPANGEVWKARRRTIVPALHKKYIAAMVGMFGESAQHGSKVLTTAALAGRTVELENFFSRLTLDIIGKAVFNYDFDSLTHDDPVIQAVYTALREAEYRSTYPIPYWNIPLLRLLVPRQRECAAAMKTINETLDSLIARCKELVDQQDLRGVDFGEGSDFLNKRDPSILHFLLAAGDEINSKQLRDDLMTMLVAGHETTAAVLTWTMHCIVDRPDVLGKLRAEVDEVVGDRLPDLEDIRRLGFTTRVLLEAMRLYPQPPVLIRRVLQPDTLDQYPVVPGDDIFISVWNIHRSPHHWDRPNDFDPYRFPLSQPLPSEVTENFAFLPFGGGRRKCIGDQFALFEAVVALAVLMRTFEFERAPDAPPVGMTTGATIHTKEGLHMRVHLREGIRPPVQMSAPAAEVAAEELVSV